MDTKATKLIGYALFYRKYSSFAGNRSLYLEDLYVTPAFRKQGIGMALLKQVAKVNKYPSCITRSSQYFNVVYGCKHV